MGALDSAMPQDVGISIIIQMSPLTPLANRKSRYGSLRRSPTALLLLLDAQNLSMLLIIQSVQVLVDQVTLDLLN